ncbi:hypothetical protein EIN_129060 [Entamoeba invadens IP1]|uniref:Flavodoxin-like domain-containing protein n=1 Tax=Entamoeba invadens IP1 TaxID=370355 RepID=L7FN81_ENTIV|nr:hypothetical protein EIN_129060 [Entamoeba invadens IP1]ELP91566.1 hypothetical protein EIN_129060 [Entamoeba invadens IP1]|eukprot:XP_004258337.1 hypothetical protein EIN_129060 [Entamoeba invadens IP1]
MSDNEKKQVAIIYFSLTGHCERMANDLANSIPSFVLRVHENKDRSGLKGYISSFGESFFNSDNSQHLIKDGLSDMDRYKAFIFVGPVWSWDLCAPLKTACKEIIKTIIKSKEEQHVFLALSYKFRKNIGDKKTFENFQKIFKGKAVVHENYLACHETDYANGLCKEKVDDFVKEVNNVCGKK